MRTRIRLYRAVGYGLVSSVVLAVKWGEILQDVVALFVETRNLKP